MANGTGENLPSKLLQQLIALFTGSNAALAVDVLRELRETARNSPTP